MFLTDAPPLQVPPQFIASAKRLAELTDDAFARVESCLSAPAPPVLDYNALAQDVAKAAEWDTEEEGEGLVRMLMSLRALREDFGFADPEDIARALASASNLDEPEESRVVLSGRAAKLITSPALELIGRARDLLGEHDNLLLTARIVTDLRPLFEDDAQAPFQAAVIGHSLRLRLAGDTKRSSFTVALDSADLKFLRYQIERALEKDATLRAFVKKSTTVVVPYQDYPE
jgi:hypothetical protein